MSAIHGVSDVTELSGPDFFALATRLGAYTGVIQARSLAEQQDNPTPEPAETTISEWGRQHDAADLKSMTFETDRSLR